MFKMVPMPLRQYAKFHGRMTRSQFFRWLGFLLVAYIAAAWLDLKFVAPMLGYLPFEEVEEQYVTIAAALLLVVPYVASNVRRLHDVDRSGWWMLFLFLPVLVVYYSRETAMEIYGRVADLKQSETLSPAIADFLINNLSWVVIAVAIISFAPVIVWSVLKGSNEPNRFGTRQ